MKKVYLTVDDRTMEVRIGSQDFRRTMTKHVSSQVDIASKV